MSLNQITELIIGACIEVHRVLGPGLLELRCRRCLCQELKLRGIPHRTEAPLAVEYKGLRLDCGYRIDLLVEEPIVVEFKAVEKMEPILEAQLITYLRLGGYQVGLLINFNIAMLKDGIKRRVFNYKQ